MITVTAEQTWIIWSPLWPMACLQLFRWFSNSHHLIGLLNERTQSNHPIELLNRITQTNCSITESNYSNYSIESVDGCTYRQCSRTLGTNYFAISTPNDLMSAPRGAWPMAGSSAGAVRCSPCLWLVSAVRSDTQADFRIGWNTVD